MPTRKPNELVPYGQTRPGFETVYTGQTSLSETSNPDLDLAFAQDEDGNVHMTYSCWGFSHLTEESWNDTIRHINAMQEALGLWTSRVAASACTSRASSAATTGFP